MTQGSVTLKRRPDWRSRLSAEIERHRREPFVLGNNDCALFAANCILAMTDVDLAASFRGRYADEDGARAALAAAGHADLAGLAASILPEEPRGAGYARAGDVAAFPLPPGEPGGWALGMVIGEQVMVLRPEGLGALPRTAANRIFKV